MCFTVGATYIRRTSFSFGGTDGNTPLGVTHTHCEEHLERANEVADSKATSKEVLCLTRSPLWFATVAVLLAVLASAAF